MNDNLTITLIFTMLSLFTFSQDKNNTETKTSERVFNEANVTELTLKSDEENGFKNINWKDIKDIFSENNKDQDIRITFIDEHEAILSDSLKDTKITMRKISVSGKSKDIDRLIRRSKKMIKKLY